MPNKLNYAANKGQNKTRVAMFSVLAKPDVSAIRTQEFNGVEHTVIPVVMLVEGVL